MTRIQLRHPAGAHACEVETCPGWQAHKLIDRLAREHGEMVTLLKGLVAADDINHAGARVLVNDRIADARALLARIEGTP